MIVHRRNVLATDRKPVTVGSPVIVTQGPHAGETGTVTALTADTVELS